MAEAVVEFLLNQLSILLQEKSGIWGGLEREFQFIKDEIGSMRAFLRDAESNEDNKMSELQEWVKQVREVAYDTEDVLDEFIMRFNRHRAKGFDGRVQKIFNSIKNIRARYRISSKMKDIKSRVEEISARHQRYGTQERVSTYTSVENVQYDGRSHALLLEEADLVGIEKPKRELISEILDDRSHKRVVSVVGMGGLGKTTLAKRVFEDANVKRHFQSRAWITVSQTFHFKTILKDLIQQLYNEIKKTVPQYLESMESDRLGAFVKNFLQKRRYIIVLDDIWTMDSWDAIKHVLPNGNCRSRVMLTTRIGDIASAACVESHGYLHMMKPLSFEESWTLFCSKTFGENCCPPHLEDVCRGILRKCDGLPLAIIAIGGVLALKNRNRLNQWETVRRSLGSQLEGSGKLDRVKRVLLLSYKDLPFYLKSCLLYVGVYPEDCEIDGWDLIKLWIAEGFVQERKGMANIEVAIDYMNELVNRSLIQVAESYPDGEIKYIRIHDLLREIILIKSREQNTATIAADGQHTKWPDINVRRLAIHGLIPSPEQHLRSKHLRSLVIFQPLNPQPSLSSSLFLCSGSKLLKVLNLEGAQFKNIPNEVFNFFLLKYLNLKNTSVEIIPKSIGKLRNLEYLNVSGTKVKELPIDISKLRKLQDLLVYRVGDYSDNSKVYGCGAPNKIGRLLSLQFLSAIDATNDEILREIGNLTQLRLLTVTKLRKEHGKTFCSSLEKLTNLWELCVHSKEDENLDLQLPMPATLQFLRVLELGGRLENVPQWIPSHLSLTRVYLLWSGLKEDPLHWLQDLPNLAELVLNHAYEGEELFFMTAGFQKLERLELTKLGRLKRVILEDEDCMPSLKELCLAGCKLVEDLPWGIQNLSKLEFVDFSDMGYELIMQLRDKNGEHYRKIAHVPKVYIGNWIDGEWEGDYLQPTI